MCANSLKLKIQSNVHNKFNIRVSNFQKRLRVRDRQPALRAPHHLAMILISLFFLTFRVLSRLVKDPLIRGLMQLPSNPLSSVDVSNLYDIHSFVFSSISPVVNLNDLVASHQTNSYNMLLNLSIICGAYRDKTLPLVLSGYSKKVKDDFAIAVKAACVTVARQNEPALVCEFRNYQRILVRISSWPESSEIWFHLQKMRRFCVEWNIENAFDEALILMKYPKIYSMVSYELSVMAETMFAVFLYNMDLVGLLGADASEIYKVLFECIRIMKGAKVTEKMIRSMQTQYDKAIKSVSQIYQAFNKYLKFLEPIQSPPPPSPPPQQQPL